MSKGYVYVLSNPSMPGLVKIGRSIHGGRQRASQLNQTGIPTPFELEFEIMSQDPEALERLVHLRFSAFRLNNNREFFSCSPCLAIERIVTCFLERYTDGLEVPGPSEKKVARRALFVAPEPEPPKTEAEIARAKEILAGFRAAFSDEVH